MKVVFIGKSDSLCMLNGKEYEVLSIECGWYRIIDETNEDYLYPPESFVVSEWEPKPPVLGPARDAFQG